MVAPAELVAYDGRSSLEVLRRHEAKTKTAVSSLESRPQSHGDALQQQRQQQQQEEEDDKLQQDEKNMRFLEAAKLYPKAMGWSIFFALGVIMLAFDPQLVSNLYALPAFRKDFGYEYKGSYIITAPWQTGLSIGNPLGQTVGALFAAYPMERFGRKRTFGALVLCTGGFVFFQFFARSLSVLLVGELFGGLVLGTYAVIAPTYASEVCPVALRGMLTAYTSLCFVVGQLLANIVTKLTSNLTTHWAYSIPFALQWVWVVLICLFLPFAPESPWWLVRKGRLDEAERSLQRLSSDKVDSKQTLANICRTDRLEQEIEAGATYMDCFKNANLVRTEIATVAYATQVLSGIYLASYATYFFELAGLEVAYAFDLGVVFLVVGVIATCLVWVLIAYIGRRTIWLSTMVMLVLLMLIIGILDCVPHYSSHPAVIWAQSILLIVWNFFYDLGIGPLVFIIMCECSAAKVRSKTIALATAAQAILGIVMTVVIPYAINPDQGNLRGKLGFLFGGLAALCLVWSYWRIPETKDRTYEELDIMFARKVPLRKFKNYDIVTGDFSSPSEQH